MEENSENTTTTDENPTLSFTSGVVCKLNIDIKPRKVPKALAEAQIIKLTQLKKHIHSLRLENEGLKAENQAMKKNIERYYELVLQAREKKKIKGNQHISIYTIVTSVIIACTLHIQTTGEVNNTGERRLMFFTVPQWSLFAFYFIFLILILLLNFASGKIRRKELYM
ncbi:hypothetical protein SteCoe_1013 [Stentor coeruleus]|uniref:Uncharacterized protein n=1 Tax=Stentor coeruleus TaxID=5963 RepID=A0A1R2D2Z7_9CILI|nr:hypothetical protein SteCoe_1013 [Stentor coeruleus]